MFGEHLYLIGPAHFTRNPLDGNCQVSPKMEWHTPNMRKICVMVDIISIEVRFGLARIVELVSASISSAQVIQVIQNEFVPLYWHILKIYFSMSW